MNPDPFRVGDLIVMDHGIETFEVAAFLYDRDLNKVMMIQDDSGRLYSADPLLYKKQRYA